jgi:hypothetical protein
MIQMKKILIIFLILFLIFPLQAQELPYQPGEHFKFKIHYGFFNAGYATLDLEESQYHGKKLLHAIGKGWTTGMSRWIMKVDDNYESYFDYENKPQRFIRKIDEGGYTKDVELHFDHQKGKVLVIDKKKKKTKYHSIQKNIHDMVSVFYYLRNHDIKNMKPGDEIMVNLFFDNETYPFKLKMLGKETIRTKFGKMKTVKFRPIVMSGRVFKEEESLTVWISDDKNKIPVLIQAKLMVGSLKASLIEYKGISYPLALKN